MNLMLPIVLFGGGVAMLLAAEKKPARRRTTLKEDVVAGGDESATSKVLPTQVSFSPDLTTYNVGSSWRIKVLDAWLNSRRLAGKLATVDYDSGWFSRIFIEDPTTFLGDITRTGKLGGSVIYGGLWLMATAGIGIYATGFASMGLNVAAALRTASATRAMGIMGHEAAAVASSLTKAGWGQSRIVLALMDFGGGQQAARFGVGRAMLGLSAGAAATGAVMAAGTLAEMGIDESFAPDLAASAVEAAADFTASHNVIVKGKEISISLLPSSNEYPAVQEFNKMIMQYILRFQKMHFGVGA